MCGIAGAFNFEVGVKVEECLSGMLETMKRRGPDDAGIEVADGGILFHTRLIVIDAETGSQPMKLERGGEVYRIVYNGELYNTDELRSRLAAQGEYFMGHSDTEVLLRAYVCWGPECLKEFNGIFAFAVFHEREGKVFMARDRVGVKPFFYSLKDGTFVFASEIKTLLQYPGIEPVIDRNGVAELLLIGPGRTPGSGVFRDIKELRPGECAVFDKSGLKTDRYWALKDRVHTDSFDDTVKRVRFLVEDAITRQLVSDVPVGTFLSGGLDSSIISSVAAEHFKKRGERLSTFSVTYRDHEKYFHTTRFQPSNDDVYIKKMVEYLDSDHHYFVIDNDILTEALYDAVNARDLPGMADVDSSLVLFCGEIKKHVTVALSGECADEIFGGYPWYRDEKIRMAYGFPWAQSTKMRSRFFADKLGDFDAEAEVNSRYEASLAEVDKLAGLSDKEARLREMVHLNTYWFMQTLLDRKVLLGQ
ncbi:MAG: asparagine synthase (glutamine-hydrolyzing) [Firmicutes bacterium]|nr:asparagine synthase (glutamine-hydrolyzing) [Bacillota bacterium]